MRIIGGALSGRRIDAPAGDATRPTSDKVREAIFNRLVHGVFTVGEEELPDPLVGVVLDLYAGAGGLGLEALSRGAVRCDFVDAAASACAVLKRNLTALGLTARARVAPIAADAFLRREKVGGYGLVFADPPYADAGDRLDRVLALLVEKGHLAPGALVVVEHGDHAAPACARGGAASGGQAGLHLLDQRRYGQTTVSFLAFITAAARGIPAPA